AGVNRVVVASGEERSPRRRAQRRGVEVVVAEPLCGEAVEGGRGCWSSERARGSETHIIQKDKKDVGSRRGRLDRLGKVRLRVIGLQAHRALERRGRRRQDLLGQGGDPPERDA